MGNRHISLTMIELARKAKSTSALGNVLTRAEDRLEAWRRLIPWPALIEAVERDAQAIEALFYSKGSKQ